jgi:hypothetical protein
MLKDCNHEPIEGSQICAICPRPNDWQQHASCLDHDPDLWFCPEDRPDLIEKAVRICLSCPIRGYCLEEGWSNRWGIWGSFTAIEREKIRKIFPVSKHSTTHRRKYIRTIAHRL